MSEGLATKISGNGRAGRPALVLMHFLGGSGREWDEVVGLLGDGYRTMTVDLPGFGGSAGVTGYSVAEMADAVEGAVREFGAERYVLVGHSMSGKVAMVLARREAGRVGSGLAGLILVAPSPPSPEPMTQEKRGGMVAGLGERRGEVEDWAKAKAYITKNESRDLPDAVMERAAREVLRMNRTAWVAWVMHGSMEDWRERVGVLELPALVVAGRKDGGLGPEAQEELTMPHLRDGVLRVVETSSHLVPMEAPEVLAGMMREFVGGLGGGEDLVGPEYLGFIESERVSPRTREVLEKRMAGPEAAEGLLSEAQVETLRAMLARVIPQGELAGIDLAGYVMARLKSGKGDGWRYAVLPEDVQAYREGLDRLGEVGFAGMDAAAQDRCLEEMAARKESVPGRWFEGVRGDAVEAYVSHPATMARIGYSGIGVGGAETPFQGFVQVGMDERENWEPVATRGEAR